MSESAKEKIFPAFNKLAEQWNNLQVEGVNPTKHLHFFDPVGSNTYNIRVAALAFDILFHYLEEEEECEEGKEGESEGASSLVDSLFRLIGRFAKTLDSHARDKIFQVDGADDWFQ